MKLRQLIREILKEEKPGLWANIRALDQHYSSDGEEETVNGIRGKKWYTGQLKPDVYKNPPERSAIIPLKFTAQLDGIGGIVIGNVFKVQKDRLPMGYQGDEVAFVVMGENQYVTIPVIFCSILVKSIFCIFIKSSKCYRI